jgi:hypothetical protein
VDENLVKLILWLVIIAVIFIVSAVQKALQRQKPQPQPQPQPQPPPPGDKPKPAQGDDFRRMLEEFLGVKVETPAPPMPTEAPVKRKKRKRRTEIPVAEPVQEPPRHRGLVTPQPTEIFQSTMSMRESHSTRPAHGSGPRVTLDEALPRDPLRRAIVVAEIFGPPRVHRRRYRLF